MNLKKAIFKETICLNLQSDSKEALIEELIDLLVASGKITDRKAALKAVMEREKKMSTGMAHGIAIPHGKTKSVDSIVAAIGLKPAGLNFESLDGEESKLFILTLSPAARTGPHIQFLAEVSRLLNDEAVREQVLNAKTVDEVYGLICSSS